MAPPSKKRKIETPKEDPVFDFDAREDYLSGFRKRKQQRIKHAKDEAAKKERELKIESRKQLREQRQKDLDEHVRTVNAMLRNPSGESASAGEEDLQQERKEEASEDEIEGKEGDATGHEDEYIDEEKYTTVTIEPMDKDDEEDNAGSKSDAANGDAGGDAKKKASTVKEVTLPDGTVIKKRRWTKDKPSTSQAKKKPKKFRYETKTERKVEKTKQRAKNSVAAQARREGTRS